MLVSGTTEVDALTRTGNPERFSAACEEVSAKPAFPLTLNSHRYNQ